MIRSRVLLPQPDGPMSENELSAADRQIDAAQGLDGRRTLAVRLERLADIAQLDDDVGGGDPALEGGRGGDRALDGGRRRFLGHAYSSTRR